jgi:fatty-acyl-CoA synthase
MPGGTPQTLRPFLWRAANLYPDREVVARTAGGTTRYDYGEMADRTARLAGALADAGLVGERVGTFCWNHHRHFETYFGAPGVGAQLHTINPLLPDEHIQYIVENAADGLLFVDPSLAEKLASAYDPDAFTSVEQFVVMGESVPEVPFGPVTDYESFIEGYATDYDWPSLSGDRPAGLCYTSGTTGKPKGVEYTQRMLWAHTMALQTPQGIPVADDDVVMPVVPMFHVNAWGMPYAMTAGGAKHVYPGPAPEPADLAALIEEEGVTLAAGVPTVWIGLLEYVEDNDIDLSTLDRLVVGGAAAPRSLFEGFDRHGVDLVHAWGMTETSPVGTVAHLKSDLEDADAETRIEKRLTQGLVVPGLEFRVVDDEGTEVPWDGEAIGELLVRGPWVTTEYFARPDASEESFEGDWLRTGDIVTVDGDGYVKVVDRTKDVVKSGGEWISSQELENTVMTHEDVVEAAVIGVPHERWQERPVAVVVPAEGADLETLAAECADLVRAEYPDWWVPDDFLRIEEIPRTATGKFDKKRLRERFGADAVEGEAPAEAAPEDAE